MARHKKLTKEEVLQITAEILDVLDRHGVEADSPYVIENFQTDYDVTGALAKILTDNQCSGCERVCAGFDEYSKKPVGERIARYSKLSRQESEGSSV